MTIYCVTERWLERNGFEPYTGYDVNETRKIVSFKVDGVLRYYLKPKDKPKTVCDCGSKHTSHPNLHSDWCRANKKTKKIDNNEDDFGYF